MPPPGSRMTAQPSRPARYFPGRSYGSEAVEDEDDSESEAEDASKVSQQPPPKASTFPSQSKRDATQRVTYMLPTAAKPPDIDLEGFVTASESSSDEDGEDNGSDEGSTDNVTDEEEESSEDEPRRPMLAPKFISKAKRAQISTPSTTTGYEEQAEQDRLRKEKADELLQLQLERDAAARAAGKKSWDDEDVIDEVDDTDGLDVAAEKAAWKLRELKRVQRDRTALVEKEMEREEIERRRNLSAEERAAEDAEYLAKQADGKEDKGKMAYMQRYHHKGAFFVGDDQDEQVKAALNRDFAGARFEDEAGDKSLLPEYMRIRDATKLGRKGRTKYKDLKSEDTGRWGELSHRPRDDDGLDERFQPDHHGRGADRTGANNAPLGERRKRAEDDFREEKRARYG